MSSVMQSSCKLKWILKILHYGVVCASKLKFAVENITSMAVVVRILAIVVMNGIRIS